MLFSI